MLVGVGPGGIVAPEGPVATGRGLDGLGSSPPKGSEEPLVSCFQSLLRCRMCQVLSPVLPKVLARSSGSSFGDPRSKRFDISALIENAVDCGIALEVEGRFCEQDQLEVVPFRPAWPACPRMFVKLAALPRDALRIETFTPPLLILARAFITTPRRSREASPDTRSSSQQPRSARLPSWVPQEDVHSLAWRHEARSRPREVLGNARVGWGGRDRTCDHAVNSRVLFQLSYTPVRC